MSTQTICLVNLFLNISDMETVIKITIYREHENWSSNCTTFLWFNAVPTPVHIQDLHDKDSIVNYDFICILQL